MAHRKRQDRPGGDVVGYGLSMLTAIGAGCSWQCTTGNAQEAQRQADEWQHNAQQTVAWQESAGCRQKLEDRTAQAPHIPEPAEVADVRLPGRSILY